MHNCNFIIFEWADNPLQRASACAQLRHRQSVICRRFVILLHTRCLNVFWHLLYIHKHWFIVRHCANTDCTPLTHQGSARNGMGPNSLILDKLASSVSGNVIPWGKVSHFLGFIQRWLGKGRDTKFLKRKIVHNCISSLWHEKNRGEP